MRLDKKILRSKIVRSALCKLMYYYIKLVLFSSRVKIIYNQFNFEDFKQVQSIYATWHGRVLFMPIINPSELESCAIVSDHNDGRLIGEVIKQAGVKLIFGSSNRNRIAALKEILGYIAQGYNFLITPDGPRGPARIVNGAIINIASNSGLPIIPASCSCKRARLFNSWDNFMFPYPFNEIAIVFNQPIFIPKECDQDQKQEFKKVLEKSLEEATIIADELCQRKKN
jgi:lysophospholipid acyltransferase (LPLAT)-like uncharacterized protein